MNLGVSSCSDAQESREEFFFFLKKKASQISNQNQVLTSLSARIISVIQSNVCSF